MNSSVVLLNFMRFKWSYLVHFAMYISLNLFEDPNYNDPPYTQEEFDTAVSELQTQGVLSLNPKMRNYDKRNKAFVIVLMMLRQLASYVNMKARGNREIILLSGFNVNDFTNHNIKGEFKVWRGEISGQVFAKWGSDLKASIYIVRYSIDEDGLRDQFTEIKIGNVSLTINGLVKMRTYLFSLSVVYSDHQGAFSPPISLEVM